MVRRAMIGQGDEEEQPYAGDWMVKDREDSGSNKTDAIRPH